MLELQVLLLGRALGSAGREVKEGDGGSQQQVAAWMSWALPRERGEQAGSDACRTDSARGRTGGKSCCKTSDLVV